MNLDSFARLLLQKPRIASVTQHRTGLPARHVVAVALGNALQFYDFVTYAFFAAQIGRTFFPADIPGGSLLASLATFGAGFLTRPLGAFVLGRLGDRIGRKPAMIASFTLIGIGVVGLPLIPPYASIGLLAPILAICFRLIQGFALGGEVGPSTAFLMEAAPPLRRGLYISLQATGADVAVMVAGLVGVGLAALLEPAALNSWGWRVALLGGAVIIPFGLLLRRTLGETLQPLNDKARGADVAQLPPGRHSGGRSARLGNQHQLLAELHDELRQFDSRHGLGDRLRSDRRCRSQRSHMRSPWRLAFR